MANENNDIENSELLFKTRLFLDWSELADMERDVQFYISAVRKEPVFPPSNNNMSFVLFEYNYLIFVQHLKTVFLSLQMSK